MIRSEILSNQNISKFNKENQSVMTLDGAVNKTAISVGILLLAAYYTFKCYI